MDNIAPESKNDLECVLCPVCGPAPNDVWMDDGKPTRYIRCRGCGTVYASPRASRRMRNAWLDRNFGVGAKAFGNASRRRPELAHEAEILRRQVSGGTMLDIGCDLGDFFEWFPPPDWDRYGVEISPSAAAYAAKKYNADVFTGILSQSGYPEAFFNLITMIDMFYYAEDPRADLLEAARIMKPDGLLGIEIPGQRWMLLRSRGVICRLLDHRWSRLETDSCYLFWFKPEGLQRLLEECGFRVVAAHVIGSPVSSSSLQNRLVGAYAKGINILSRFSSRSLTWAPKYLILAKKII